MNWLGDAQLAHLRRIADQPDLHGTKYRLKGELARGGMGVVYIVEDLELQREAALKVARDPRPAPDAAQRMMREARVIAYLEHPGIVPIHDVGTLPDGRIYYAMKLVRGRRLDELPGQVATGERLRIFQRVCEVVAFAHAHGVIHRDLKPANILVGAFGEVLVVDWGVAKVMTTRDDGEGQTAAVACALGEHLTHDGVVIGTPGYMAPEQERGELARVDARADVYALGALLKYLFTGSHPVPGRRVDAGEASLPPPIAAIVGKAMAGAPEVRYSGAGELIKEVERFLYGGKVEAHQEGMLERIGRWAAPHKIAITLVLAYLLMRLLIFLIFRR